MSCQPTITTWRQRQKQNSGFNTFLLLSQCINTISKLDLIDSANLWRDNPTHAEVFRGKFTTSHHPPESLFVLTDYGLLACSNAIIEKTLQKYENNKKARTKRRATGWHCNIRLNVEGVLTDARSRLLAISASARRKESQPWFWYYVQSGPISLRHVIFKDYILIWL
jgi:hypothetical protein